MRTRFGNQNSRIGTHRIERFCSLFIAARSPFCRRKDGKRGERDFRRLIASTSRNTCESVITNAGGSRSRARTEASDSTCVTTEEHPASRISRSVWTCA